MDILDIRKKAKGLKNEKADAEETQPVGETQSTAPDEPGVAADAAPAESAEPKKSAKKKNAKKSAPVLAPPVEPNELVIDEPEQDELLSDEPADDDAPSGLVIDYPEDDEVGGLIIDYPADDEGDGLIIDEPAGDMDEYIADDEDEMQCLRDAVAAEELALENIVTPPKAEEERPRDMMDASYDDESDADNAKEDDTIEYLGFMLGAEEYAVKVEEVKEIIRYQDMTTVPRSPDFVLGIISLRGVILPVFDIRKRLGLTISGRTRSTRIIVVSDAGQPQGLLVDKVTGVVRLAAGTIEPPPGVIGGAEAEFIEGVGRIGERLLILFKISTVLSVE